MKTESDVSVAVLFDVLDALGRDQRAGALKDLQHYLERFPGHEEVVAREYLRTKQAHDAPAAAAPDVASAGSTGTKQSSDPDPDSLDERIRRLSEPMHRGGRYAKEEAIGSGGMGIVHRVRDLELDRILALKVMRLHASQCGPLYAARFLEEAQVTAQLDHPGIVPVHEVGVNEEGRLYFAMKLVRGRVLRTILDLLERGEEGWNLPRVLTVLLRVCEAMAYSHSKGVIHRDLKPGNIMVGHFGEVYVMDWGLARILGRPDLHDLRIDKEPRTVSLHTVRHQEFESDDPSPLLTMDGEVVGTPAYMSPEQARGELELLSPRSDVYSIGAILYHALTGQAPFVPRDAKVQAQSVLWRLIEGPPTPVVQLRPALPMELVAICDKAMARDPGQRYPDMGALAKDLSAFLEQRVVEAYETGAWAEARKWMRRNKPLAATLAAAVLLALAGLGGIGYVQAAGRKVAEQERERADAKALEAEQNLVLSERNATLAQEQQRRAEAETAKVLRLSDVKVLQQLEGEADALWPAYPDRIVELESWLSRARSLTSNLAMHRATLSQMRALAQPWSEHESERERARPLLAAELADKRSTLLKLITRLDQSYEELGRQATEERVAELEAEVAALTADVESRPVWRFSSLEEQWQHDVLSQLVADLEGMEAGLLSEDAITPAHGWSVPKRLAFAQGLMSGFGSDGEFARAWSDALIPIDATYPGLGLAPQLGLLPLGPDPRSGLWEFAHLQTGEPAVRDSDGNLVFAEATGLVFVLLPGGTFSMGSQKDDPLETNYDPRGSASEGPVHAVTLSPFFFSKYEMTQGQWLRFTGRSPSYYQLTRSLLPPLSHPVEQVSWNTCFEICERMGLSLPSEAQWEYGARGGTTSPWWTGNERDSLRGAVNLADQSAARDGAPWADIRDWPDLDDGYGWHAPVDRFDPNPFGLHSVHGNIWEWCLDGSRLYTLEPPQDPVADPGSSLHRVTRGGCFDDAAVNARSAVRGFFPPEYASLAHGLRPARALTR